MTAAGQPGVRRRSAISAATGDTTNVIVRRHAAAAQAERTGTAQLSHRETVQLSHRARTETTLTTAYQQLVETKQFLPAIRQSFDWHAGCWLSGVGTQLDNGASHGRLCRRGTREARADMSCNPPQGRGK